MGMEIKEWFSKGIYQIFVTYCEINSLNTMADLDNFDFNCLLNLRGMGIGKLEKIKRRYTEYYSSETTLAAYDGQLHLFDDKDSNDDISKDAFDLSDATIEEQLLSHPLFSGLRLNNQSIDKKKLKYDHSVSKLMIKVRAKHILQAFYIKTIQDLLFYTPDELMKIRGCGKNTIKDLQTAVKGYLIQIEEDLSDSWFDFFSMLDSTKKFKKKYIVILMKRLGFDENRTYTLEEIGESHGITRERIRQILVKIGKQLQCNEILLKLEPFWIAIDLVLEQYVGMVSIDTLAEEMQDLLQWQTPFPSLPLFHFLQMFQKYELDEEFELVGFKNCQCNCCHRISSFLKREIIASNSIEKSVILRQLNEECISANCANFKEGKSFDFGFLQSICNHIFPEYVSIFFGDKYLYSQENWHEMHKNKYGRIEEMLKNENRPIHISEIGKMIQEKYGQLLRATHISSLLANCPNLILWDRGTYVHSDTISIPHQLLEEIHGFLTKQLHTNLPLLYINGMYERFKHQCDLGNIPSPTALYSLLRERGSDELVFPYYPTIFLKTAYTQRKPLTDFAEAYLLEQKQPIRTTKFMNHFEHEMGVNYYTIQNIIANSEKIVKINQKFISHVCFTKSSSNQTTELLFTDTNKIQKIDFERIKSIDLTKQQQQILSFLDKNQNRVTFLKCKLFCR